MRGEGIVYSAQWYDESGTAQGLPHSLAASEGRQATVLQLRTRRIEVSLMTPAPTDTAGNVPDDDAKSKKASSSESDSRFQ